MQIVDPEFETEADAHPERCRRVAVFFARDIDDEVVMLDADHADYDVPLFRKDWGDFMQTRVLPVMDDRDRPNDDEAPMFLSSTEANAAAAVNSFNGAGSGIPHLGVFVGFGLESDDGYLLFKGEVRGLKPDEYALLRDPVLFWAAVLGDDTSTAVGGDA